MNKMYQKLKKKCISLVLFALLAAFIVPYYTYAASSGTESATETSETDSTGDFSISEGESSRKKVEEDSSEDEQPLTKKDIVSEEQSLSDAESFSSVSDSAGITSGQAGTDKAEASKNAEANTQESTEGEQTLTKKEIKTVRKNLQLGRSYGFYVYGAEESATQSSDEKDGVAVQAAEAKALSPDVDTVLSKVRSYILSKDTKPDISSIWNVIGLERSGLGVPESYKNLFYSNVIAYCQSKNWQITKTKYSDYSKLIIALTSIGVDARNVMGHNLLSYLSDYENVNLQGNNGPIWALIALKCNPQYEIPVNPSAKEQNSEELLLNRILEMQCADGGWTLTGTTGDSDMTGMALQALAPYYKAGNETVTAAVEKAFGWISANQLASGGFGTIGTETSESVSQIITALSGLGIDCGTDSRFIKVENGNWPMTGLFQYYMSEGGFMHVAAGAGNNGGGAGGTIDGMATEQGFYATVAYKRLLDKKTFLYDMSDVTIAPGTQPVVSPTIDIGNSGSSTTTATAETQPTASKVKVIKVHVNYSKIYLTKGKSKTLKVTISPSNAANKSVKWTSSNKKIATVSSKGKVTGKKVGTAIITVKAKDGSGKKATCKVVVTAAATATKAKKTTTTTTARSQTKRITTPVPSGTTNRSGSTGTGSTGTSSTPAASGTTKTLPSGSSSGGSSTNTTAKGATGTTAKKKDTAAEATTGGWSFSGDNYVPDTYSSEGETDAAEANTEAAGEDTSSKSRHINPTVLYVAGGVGGLAVVEALGFVVYKKRKSIAGGIAGIVNKLHKGGDVE